MYIKVYELSLTIFITQFYIDPYKSVLTVVKCLQDIRVYSEYSLHLSFA